MKKIALILMLFMMLCGVCFGTAGDEFVFARYSMEETSGLTTADYKGLNNGTVSQNASGMTSTGQVGNSFIFDDSNSEYINLGTLSGLDLDVNGDEFYISFWIKSAAATNVGTIFSKCTNTSKEYQVYFSGDAIGVYAGKEASPYITTTTIADGTWHFILIANYNQGGVYKTKVYVDGVADATAATVNGSSTTAVDWLIGARHDTDNTDFANYLDAELDEFQISNRFIQYVDGTLAAHANTETGNTWDSAYLGAAGLQTALDKVPTELGSIVFIRNNVTTAAQIDIDTGGGYIDRGKWFRVVGCDAAGDELSAGSYVTLDANGGAYDVVSISGGTAIESIKLEHLRFTNTAKAAASDCGVRFAHTSVAMNFVIEDCKMDNVYQGIRISDGNTRNILVINTDISGCVSNCVYLVNVWDFNIDSCTITGTAGQIALNYTAADGTYNYGTVRYSDIIGGTTGLYLQNCKPYIVWNNTFYNQTVSGITLDIVSSGYNSLQEWNNIYDPADAVNDYAIYRYDIADTTIAGGLTWTSNKASTTAKLFGHTYMDDINPDVTTDPAYANAPTDLTPSNPEYKNGGRPENTSIGSTQSSQSVGSTGVFYNGYF